MTDSKRSDGRLNVRLPRAFLKSLKLECVRREVTLQAATKAALEAWLKAGKGKP